MNRQLILMRHAKSAWDTDAASDFDRPLAKRGRRDAPKMGAWLASQDLRPDFIMASPARRARQTAKRVCKAMDIPPARIYWAAEIYEAAPEGLMDLLQRVPEDATRALLIGHNPALEALLRRLCAPPPVPPVGAKLMPTGAAAVLEFQSDWRSVRRGQAQLKLLQHPRRLKKPG